MQISRKADRSKGWKIDRKTQHQLYLTINIQNRQNHINDQTDDQTNQCIRQIQMLGTCRFSLWPITNCQLPITNCQLPIANCQLSIANYQLTITNCQLPITSWQLPIVNYPCILTRGFANFRKINYFECFDGSQIRSLEGSLSGAIQGLKVTNDGKYMITGGQDRLLKVNAWSL